MTVHQFAVSVPNPSDDSAVTTLTLEPMPVSALRSAGYSLPERELRIRAARLIQEQDRAELLGCAGSVWLAVRWIDGMLRRILGLAPSVPPVHLTLEPRASAEITIIIEIARGVGAAAMQVVDRRAGEVVGGVTLLAVNGISEHPPAVIEAAKPCPLVIDRESNWIPVGGEPDEEGFGPAAPSGSDIQLVIWVVNPTEIVLEEATAYLEHLGGSGATFVPTTWNLGTFEPGARFPLTWTVRGSGAKGGRWQASVVVAAAGLDPTRLAAYIAFVAQDVVEVEPDVA